MTSIAAATILPLTAAPALLAGAPIKISDAGVSLLIGIGLVVCGCLFRRVTRTQ